MYPSNTVPPPLQLPDPVIFLGGWKNGAKETQDAMAIICGAMAALLEPLKAALVSKKDTCHARKHWTLGEKRRHLNSHENVSCTRQTAANSSGSGFQSSWNVRTYEKIHRIRIQSSSRHTNNIIHRQYKRSSIWPREKNNEGVQVVEFMTTYDGFRVKSQLNSYAYWRPIKNRFAAASHCYGFNVYIYRVQVPSSWYAQTHTQPWKSQFLICSTQNVSTLTTPVLPLPSIRCVDGVTTKCWPIFKTPYFKFNVQKLSQNKMQFFYIWL